MGTPQTTPTPPAENAPALSQVERITNVFFAPSQTFADLKRNASWWAPWLLVGVSSVLLAFSVQQKIGFEQAWENSLRFVPKQAERIEQMPADKQQQTRQVSGKFTMVRAYVHPLPSLIFAIVVAAILMGVFNFGLGTEVPFSVSLAIVIYAGLPNLIKNLLAASAIFLGMSPEGFILDNPLGSNLGFYMDPGKSFPLYSLGSALDLFTIWSLILTAIGFASVSKIKRGTAMSVVFGLYIVSTLVITGAFSLLM
jgi:hypothetical protein